MFFPSFFTDWSGANDHERVQRQLSVSSDSKLLDEDIREETRVIMRPKKPPRPKSEVFLNKQDLHPRRKRFSAFGVSKMSNTVENKEFAVARPCYRILNKNQVVNYSLKVKLLENKSYSFKLAYCIEISRKVCVDDGNSVKFYVRIFVMRKRVI